MSKDPVVATANATKELLARERFVGLIYDVCRSDDGITNAVIAKGLSVFHTSVNLIDYDCLMPNIITEPHPTIGAEFIQRALYVTSQKIALLLPLKFMETLAAKNIIDKTPLVRVYVLTKRLPFRRGCMGWFVWEKGNFDKPSIRWI